MLFDTLKDLAHRYDTMLIDQYGVLHDGQTLFPNVLDALAQLHEVRIRVVILTNSGKRSASNIERLLRLGVPRHYFIDCMSSGEVCYQTLPMRRAKMIGRQGENYGFDKIENVDDVEKAEALLILGSDAPNLSLDDYRQMLAPYVRKGLVAICCNPDRQMITKDGLQFAPGAIAELYEKMGGYVRWVGKPYPEIYHAALKLVDRPQRVLCIGDSPDHDISGGKNAGLDTALVMTGLSEGRDALTVRPVPTYFMESFRWTNLQD